MNAESGRLAVKRSVRTSRFGDEARFLKQLCTNPHKMGAVTPSGPYLARAMAGCLDPSTQGRILELGPGTGVVTAAIVAAGISQGQLTCVEYSDAFANLLAMRFPQARIVQGDAFELSGLMRDEDLPLAGIVSSLPLLNSPEEKRRKLLLNGLDLIEPGGPFVQFSYALVPPIPQEPGLFTVEKSGWILRNVPPARVWVYRKVAAR